jgi:pyruvate formate lyase activating enzyme
MSTGVVFDIREFSVHDGPGIRTTVFLKGCPLTCIWCHNPEGQSIDPQVIRSPAGARLAGTMYTAAELADYLNAQAEILRNNEGGVTFSGGEPLLQADFVAEVIDQLNHIHVVLDTCGYGAEEDFHNLLVRSDLIYFDLKLIDRTSHIRYTGCENELILDNLGRMSASGKPFVIRVPLVPGVTDTNTNLEAIARLVAGLPGLERVDLLPYNRAAGAKYRSIGREFTPEYDETKPPNANTSIFETRGIEVRVL